MEYRLSIAGRLGSAGARAAPKSGKKHRKIHDFDVPLTSEFIGPSHTEQQF
jgi:hypothetical protein